MSQRRDGPWRLYNAAGPGWRVALALARLAGLRKSDILSLKWTQVYFDRGQLTFRQQKTDWPCSPPICPELREILADLPRPLKLDAPVLPDAPYLQNQSRDFAILCRKARRATLREAVAHVAEILYQ